jgi:hypothetical protein
MPPIRLSLSTPISPLLSEHRYLPAAWPGKNKVEPGNKRVTGILDRDASGSRPVQTRRPNGLESHFLRLLVCQADRR